MTQDQFYQQWPVERHTKEGRLIVDLRCGGFSWAQIDTVLTQMTEGPYWAEWSIQEGAAR